MQKNLVLFFSDISSHSEPINSSFGYFLSDNFLKDADDINTDNIFIILIS